MAIKKPFLKICISLIKSLLWLLDASHRTANKISNTNTKKFTHVQEHNATSDFGTITNAFRTVPYQTWELITTSHQLIAADKHRVIRENGDCVWLEELKVGDTIRTSNGIEPVISIRNLNIKIHMFCIEVNTIDPEDHNNHLYYTNGILSHNTATSAAYILWFSIFQETVNVLIAANKFRAATEIMDRIRFAYEELPDWLRPGVTTYNVQKIVFDNGSKIESTTTTPDSGRGKSISLLYCLAGDTTVTVRNKITGLIENISLQSLHERLGNRS